MSAGEPRGKWQFIQGGSPLVRAPVLSYIFSRAKRLPQVTHCPALPGKPWT